MAGRETRLSPIHFVSQFGGTRTGASSMRNPALARASRWALVASAAAFVSVGAQQRANTKLTLDQYMDWEEVQAPQFSPNGTQIAFGRRWVDKMNDRWETSIWIANADGSRPRQLVQGSDVKWSPDGTRIAYIARGEPSGNQIFVRYMD